MSKNDFISYPGKDGIQDSISIGMIDNHLKKLGYNLNIINKTIDKFSQRKTPVGDVLKLIEWIAEDFKKEESI